YNQGDLIRNELAQEVSFLNKAAIKLTLDHLPENSRVLIDASQTSYIDHDVLELIKEFQQTQSKMKNIELTLKGFRDKYLLEEIGFVHVEHKNQ
ncbi:MAG: SulP family inorganic anion transporter, partial [Saprospiraceae bacterium]